YYLNCAPQPEPGAPGRAPGPCGPGRPCYLNYESVALWLTFDGAAGEVTGVPQDVSGFGMDWSGKKVHFIGIGGYGMSGLARVLLAAGARVSGSDVRASDRTRWLETCGAQVRI